MTVPSAAVVAAGSEAQAAVLEAAVAQPVPKGVERLGGQVHVGPALGDFVVVQGREPVRGRVEVRGSLPEGLTSPKRISASALPPCSPGYQISRMAGTFWSIQLIATGLPFSITTIVAGLAATIFWTKS